ncbi:MAG TPA: DUF1045 domain-containing protein [Burkholderiaceae bacterium]
MTPADPCRYALYFAPAADSPWWRFGCAWLGRDALAGTAVGQPQLDAVDAATQHAATAAPRRYGFHATLRSPFRLRPGAGFAQLAARAEELAACLQAFDAGALEPGRLGRFVALLAPQAAAPLERLARECVFALEDLRAPLEAGEIARRGRGLDARGGELLARYGYPYVMERYRFHMTLTGDLETALADRFVAAAAAAVRALAREAPLAIDRLCLFHEPGPGADFERLADYPLRPAQPVSGTR